MVVLPLAVAVVGAPALAVVVFLLAVAGGVFPAVAIAVIVLTSLLIAFVPLDGLLLWLAVPSLRGAGAVGNGR